MDYCGLICEYNPLHSGHAYQLSKIKELGLADAIICVMSGDFVQRAEPAIVSKHIRAHLALSSGADAVVQMPTAYTVCGGEKFSDSALAILSAIRGMKYLAFGCETQNFDMLKKLAEIRARENELFKHSLRNFLASGLPYHKSLIAATLRVCNSLGYSESECGAILNRPNNILAIEYLKSIYQNEYNIQPIFIHREDNYNSTELKGSFTSATAIRQSLINMKKTGSIDAPVSSKSSGSMDAIVGANVSRSMDAFVSSKASECTDAFVGSRASRSMDAFVSSKASECTDAFVGSKASGSMDAIKEMRDDGVDKYLPYSSEILVKNMVDYEIFDQLLLHSMRMAGVEGIAQLADCAEGLEHKLYKNVMECVDINSALERTKSKRYTYARLKRIALQSLLNITKEDIEAKPSAYGKLLGVKKSLKPHLSDLTKNIIIKHSDPKPPNQERIIEIDQTAETIYAQLTNTPATKSPKTKLIEL